MICSSKALLSAYQALVTERATAVPTRASDVLSSSMKVVVRESSSDVASALSPWLRVQLQMLETSKTAIISAAQGDPAAFSFLSSLMLQLFI